jgi:YesN/AraC family two-component response regulator
MGDATLYQILVVEDDAAILDWYVECLVGLYRVVAVSCGRDAIDRVKRKGDIDLAVIDYQLPDLSGIETMKEIKDCAPSVPVILVTAYGDEDLAVAAFRNGARDYLKKPFSTSELLAKIDFYLALRIADKRRRKNTVFAEDGPADGGQTPHAVTPGQYRNIQVAVRFINDNYHQTDINLEETARVAGMSPSHFSRMFRKVMGLTYQGYLGSRRIAKAQNLLRNSVLSVTQIAQAIGYSDITGFGRTFKKLSGHTPTAYRNLPCK